MFYFLHNFTATSWSCSKWSNWCQQRNYLKLCTFSAIQMYFSGSFGFEFEMTQHSKWEKPSRATLARVEGRNGFRLGRWSTVCRDHSKIVSLNLGEVWERVSMSIVELQKEITFFSRDFFLISLKRDMSFCVLGRNYSFLFIFCWKKLRAQKRGKNCVADWGISRL